MSRLSFVGWLVVLAAAAASGVAYSFFVLGGDSFIGAVYAAGIIGPLLAFEQDLILPRFRLWLIRLPTAAYLVLALLVYVAIIALATFVVGSVLWLVGLEERWEESAILSQAVLIYAFLVSGPMVFILRLRDLVGRDVFVSLLVSRYRKPRQENRIFLLIDLAGSTSYAERFGDLRTQMYLGAFFKTMALSVRRFGGSIDDYIGDAALVTWRLDNGIRHAACIRCVMHLLEAIDAGRENWIREFGEVPSIRAALHGGPVIVAEIGLDHRKITFFGDTVNATARLEGLARDLKRRFLVSDSLLESISLPATFKAEPLGCHVVKGKERSLSVTSIDFA